MSEEKREYILLTSDRCMPCRIVKEFMRILDIPFKAIEYTHPKQLDNNENIARLVEKSGMKYVPQLFSPDGEFIAGGGIMIPEKLKERVHDMQKGDVDEVLRRARKHAYQDMAKINKSNERIISAGKKFLDKIKERTKEEEE